MLLPGFGTIIPAATRKTKKCVGTYNGNLCIHNVYLWELAASKSRVLFVEFSYSYMPGKPIQLPFSRERYLENSLNISISSKKRNCLSGYFRIFTARGPLGPLSKLNSTLSPSSKASKSTPSKAERWKKTSFPSSLVIKPKPHPSRPRMSLFIFPFKPSPPLDKKFHEA